MRVSVKAVFSVVFVSALLFCLAELVLCSIFGDDSGFYFDFQLRYNEARCVLSGVDPYLVWNGSVSHPEFSPFRLDFAAGHNYVHAYPPWEYSLMMPFALLPKTVACGVYLALELCACVFMLYAVFRRYVGTDGCRSAGFAGLSLSLLAAYALFDCQMFGNFGIWCAASVFLMACFLERKRDFAAGLCWSVLMVKPQIGLLFAVPLLVGRRYKTVAVAAVACVLLTIPPAVLCGRSPVTMILSVLDYGSNYNVGGFVHNVFFDPTWFPGVNIPQQAGMVCNLMIGVAVCMYLSIRFWRSDDWSVRLLPAAALCVLWAVSRPHDACVYLFVLMVTGKIVYGLAKSAERFMGLIVPILMCVVFQRLGVPMALGVWQSLVFIVLAVSLPLLLVWGAERFVFWVFPVAVASLLSLFGNAVFVAFAYLVLICVYLHCPTVKGFVEADDWRQRVER